MSRDEILAVLDRPMTSAEIARASGQNLGTVRHLLGVAKKRGFVAAVRDGPRYIYVRAE
jgi:DNA-binding IclR family transcriptional regulator